VRKHHPTIPEGDSGWAIIDKFGGMLVPPRPAEGFTEVLRISSQEEVDAVVTRFSAMLQQN